MLSEIENLMRAGDWEAAIAATKKALVSQPTNGLLHAYEGMAYYRLGRYQEAEPAFKRAHTLDPRLSEAAVKQAQCLEKLRRYKEALDVAKDWLPKRPNDVALLALHDHLKNIHASEEHDGWERTRRHDLTVVESFGSQSR
jgi:tetratricopeptide (TPR) repeat protein